jgi:hypothetical protein
VTNGWRHRDRDTRAGPIDLAVIRPPQLSWAGHGIDGSLELSEAGAHLKRGQVTVVHLLPAGVSPSPRRLAAVPVGEPICGKSVTPTTATRPAD